MHIFADGVTNMYMGMGSFYSENREIDLMAGISYNDDRVNSMLFPAYEMINETFYIYKDTDDTTIKCGNIDSYAGKKIGVVNKDKRMITALKDCAERLGKGKAGRHSNPVLRQSGILCGRF